ncbi:MAG: hypothetical protein KGL39_10690 [Patescibacteria group bacterium]|nr:hypothetical protein [Patescibacteria group bacterium]
MIAQQRASAKMRERFGQAAFDPAAYRLIEKVMEEAITEAIDAAVAEPKKENEAARQALLDANFLIFGPDGTLDFTLPLLIVAQQAAKRIGHLRNLYEEVSRERDGAFFDGWKAAEEHHGIKKAL